MGGLDYFLRLAAVACVAALLGLFIARPSAPDRMAERVTALSNAPGPALATKPCGLNREPLTGPFANIADVISVSPLGGITAPGEVQPAPYIRVNTRKGATVFERRQTDALAPARVDITAIERRLSAAETGKTRTIWTVHFALCEGYTLVYDDLESVSSEILERAGGLASFEEVGGPEHLAKTVQIRVAKGAPVGSGRGFDVAFHDLTAPPATLARPERHATNIYARAGVTRTSPELIKAVTPDVRQARCAIDYMPDALRANWSALLKDQYGMRTAKGADTCRTQLITEPGAAQGVWHTSPAHNGATTKVSAIALGPDTINPEKQIFALHGRVKSLTPELIALGPFEPEQKEKAAKDFMTFAGNDETSLVNTPFNAVVPGPLYCYQGLRANFVGPRMSGVMLMSISDTQGTQTPLLKLEARGDIAQCADLPQPWGFSGAETTFYR
ncbi:MAG: hypothetical protein AAF850_05805 [Pseudomonadota bacterium]